MPVGPHLLLRIASPRAVDDSRAMPPTAAVRDHPHCGGRRGYVDVYRPRAAEHTVLHRIVRTHLATFLPPPNPLVARRRSSSRSFGSSWGAVSGREASHASAAMRIRPSGSSRSHVKARGVCDLRWPANGGAGGAPSRLSSGRRGRGRGPRGRVAQGTRGHSVGPQPCAFSAVTSRVATMGLPHQKRQPSRRRWTFAAPSVASSSA